MHLYSNRAIHLNCPMGHNTNQLRYKKQDFNMTTFPLSYLQRACSQGLAPWRRDKKPEEKNVEMSHWVLQTLYLCRHNCVVTFILFHFQCRLLTFSSGISFSQENKRVVHSFVFKVNKIPLHNSGLATKTWNILITFCVTFCYWNWTRIITINTFNHLDCSLWETKAIKFIFRKH